MAISSALIVGPLLLIVFVDVWGVGLIATSPDVAVAEDVMVGLETIVVVVTATGCSEVVDVDVFINGVVPGEGS